MAHSLSAKKRIRQNAKHRARNRFRKDQIKAQIKTFSASLSGGDLAGAETELRKATQVLDRVASQHTIHRNAASRTKSRLSARVKALKKK